VAFTLFLGCSNDDTVAETTAKLTAECIEDAAELEETDWLCPNDLTLECEDGGANPEVIYLEPFGDLPESCEEIDLSLNDEGPFELGTHEIVITAEASNGDDDPVEDTCTARSDIVDTEPPEANEEPIELWPPNHKFHLASTMPFRSGVLRADSDCAVRGLRRQAWQRGRNGRGRSRDAGTVRRTKSEVRREVRCDGTTPPSNASDTSDCAAQALRSRSAAPGEASQSPSRSTSIGGRWTHCSLAKPPATVS